MNEMIENPTIIPEWMTKGKTTLIFKTGEENKAKNYRPITCLPTMYKLLTLMMTERVYDHVTDNQILPFKQKGLLGKQEDARNC